MKGDNNTEPLSFLRLTTIPTCDFAQVVNLSKWRDHIVDGIEEAVAEGLVKALTDHGHVPVLKLSR